MKKFSVFLIATLLVFWVGHVTSVDASLITLMVGDNDGYGFGAAVVPDGGSLPVPGFDNRSAAEAVATNGAQQTDIYRGGSYGCF